MKSGFAGIFLGPSYGGQYRRFFTVACGINFCLGRVLGLPAH